MGPDTDLRMGIGFLRLYRHETMKPLILGGSFLRNALLADERHLRLTCEVSDAYWGEHKDMGQSAYPRATESDVTSEVQPSLCPDLS